MNSLFRPALRSVAVRQIPRISSHPTPLPRPPRFSASPYAALRVRFVASTVSNRPGSQTLEHATTNVKEEIGNSAQDLAKVIAGSNIKAGISDSSADSFVRCPLRMELNI